MSTDARADAQAPHRPDGAYAWFRLVVSVILGTIGSIGLWAVVVVLPAVQAEFAVDRADASLPFTAMMVGFALGNAIVGRYVDRLGITLPVIGAALALGSGFALAAMTTNIWQFTLIQGVLIGLGTSATFGPLVASISHWFERRRGIAVAAAASGNYLSGAIWPVFMQQLIDSEGWRTTYMVIGLRFCVVTMIPLALLLRGNPPDQTDPYSADETIGRSRPAAIGLSPTGLQLLLIVAGISCCVAMAMPQVHLVAYCVDLGYGPAVGAEMLSVMLATGVVSRLLSGFIADYIGGVRTVILGSVLQCIAARILSALRRPDVALRGLLHVRSGAGRHRAELRARGPRVSAGARGRPARRHRRHVNDPWYGLRRLDVRLDLRSDRLLSDGVYQWAGLERAQHFHNVADPMAYGSAAAG